MTEMKGRKTGRETDTRPGRSGRKDRPRGKRRNIIFEARTLIASPLSCLSEPFSLANSSGVLVAWELISFLLHVSRLSCEYTYKYTPSACMRESYGGVSPGWSTPRESHCPVPWPFHLLCPSRFFSAALHRATVRHCRVFTGTGIRRTCRSARRALLTLTSGPARTGGSGFIKGTFREVNGIFDLWRGLQTWWRRARRVEKAREFSRGLMRDGRN